MRCYLTLLTATFLFGCGAVDDVTDENLSEATSEVGTSSAHISKQEFPAKTETLTQAENITPSDMPLLGTYCTSYYGQINVCIDLLDSGSVRVHTDKIGIQYPAFLNVAVQHYGEPVSYPMGCPSYA